jgi:hypothetical protein
MPVIVWANERDTRSEVRHLPGVRHTIRRTSGRADERTSGRADERTSGRADERTSGRADERTPPMALGTLAGSAPDPTTGSETAETGASARSLDRSLHTVLAIGRNVAALTRLRDVLTVFEDDHRIRVLFTVSPGSPFADGTRELIQHFESKFVPWQEALELRPSLAVSASSNGELHRLRAPLIMLPHGAGYHKRHDTADDDGVAAPYGLSTAQLMHQGRLIPDVLGVSHGDQLHLLAAHCPEALPRAVVIGDPSLDRMAASLHLRDAYRHAMGVSPSHELLLVASTWKAGSQYDALPGAAREALRDLPADQFKVAQVLHPNIWSEFGADQIRRWSGKAREAGLILIPWREGWQAALVASDYVIGDHGSVTFYGAALGKPLLLAAFGSKDIVPATPVERLGELALRLDPDSDLTRQLTAAKEPHLVERCRAAAADAFDVPGQSIEILREIAYRLLNLPRPPEPADPPLVPLPDFHADQVERIRAHRVYVRLSRGPETHPAPVQRYPLNLRPDPDYTLDETAAEPHIAADVGGARIGQLQSAAVVYARLHQDEPDLDATHSRERVRTMGRSYPGCHVAALTDRHRCLMQLRDGTLLTAALSRDGDGEGIDPVIIASIVYAHMITGAPATRESRLLQFRIGEKCVSAELKYVATDQR